MARIRTIKPEFLKHERLFDAESETGLPIRLAFAGLWTQCDREGRFEWRPRMLKAEILPYDEVEFSRVLDALSTRGFVVRYACGDREYGYIPSWKRHQVVNNREAASQIPEPPENTAETDASTTRPPRDTAIAKGKGKEGEREGNTEPKGSGADAPPDFEKLAFARGKAVLGSSAGGVVARLKREHCKTWPATVALIEEAAGKHSPMEWVQGILRKADPDEEIYRNVL